MARSKFAPEGNGVFGRQPRRIWAWVSMIAMRSSFFVSVTSAARSNELNDRITTTNKDSRIRSRTVRFMSKDLSNIAAYSIYGADGSCRLTLWRSPVAAQAAVWFNAGSGGTPRSADIPDPADEQRGRDCKVRERYDSFPSARRDEIPIELGAAEMMASDSRGDCQWNQLAEKDAGERSG